MGIPVDFTGVEATQGSGPIPDGDYICLIDEAKEQNSRAGTPGISVTLKVVVGEYEGRLLWDNIWLTAAALGMAKWKLQCAGLPIPEGQFTLEARNLVGRRVKVTVRQEEYEGKARARVKGWDAPGDGQAVGAGSRRDDEIPF